MGLGIFCIRKIANISENCRILEYAAEIFDSKPLAVDRIDHCVTLIKYSGVVNDF